jgi:hypothetical protein
VAHICQNKKKQIAIKIMIIKSNREKNEGWNCKNKLKIILNQINSNQNNRDQILVIKKIKNDEMKKEKIGG